MRGIGRGVAFFGAVAALWSAGSPAQAAPGDLDPAFSKDGKAVVAFPGHQRASQTGSYATIGGDGRVVVVTTVRRKPKKDRDNDRASESRDIALARVTAKGKYDRSFSKDGRTIIRIPGDETAVATASAIDGSTVIVANTRNDMLVMRVNKSGGLDRTFSGDGRTIVDFGLEDQATDVALAPNGSIVVVGQAQIPRADAGSNGDFAIAQLTASGGLDPTFSQDGRAAVDFSGPDEYPYVDFASAVTTNAQGAIVVAGTTTRTGEYDDERQIAVARLLPTGELDPAFAGGTALANYSASASGYSVALDSTGAVVVGGASNDNAAAARFGADGVLDSSFATDGTALVDIAGYDDLTDALVVQADNRPVLVGRASGLRDRGDFAAVRLTTDGLPDPTFSDDGKVSVDFGDDADNADSARLQADGKIILVGTIGDYKSGIARLLVAEGPADADADKVEDVKDACPDQYGTRANGCPKRDRHHDHED